MTTLQQKAKIVASYDALFKVSIAQAQAAGLDEIRISVPRAKELHRDLTILKQALEVPAARREPAHFNRLDAIFEQQASVINQALTKIIG